MLPKKQRHIFYAALLLTLSVVCTSAVANSSGIALFTEVSSPLNAEPDTTIENDGEKKQINFQNKALNSGNAASAPFFATIIQGADEEVNCADNGLTIARFNLCGNFDDRIIGLTGDADILEEKADNYRANRLGHHVPYLYMLDENGDYEGIVNTQDGVDAVRKAIEETVLGVECSSDNDPHAHHGHDMD